MARSPRSRSSSRSRAAARSEVPRQEVHCPGCGATYKVPEQDLDVRVKCGRCKQTFTPKNILRQTRRKGPGLGRPSSGMVTFILALAVLVILTIVVTNHFSQDQGTGQEPGRESADTGPSKEELARMNRPLKRLEEWIGAALSGNRRLLERLTRIDDFYAALPAAERPKNEKGEPRPYASLEPLEKIEWRDKVIQALAEGTLIGPMQGRQFLPGTVRAVGSAKAPLFQTEVKVSADFNIPPEVRRVWQIHYRLVNIGTREKPLWRVAGLEMGKEPPAQKEKKKRRPKVPKGLDPSKLVRAEAKDGEETTGGSHYKHPIVPLGHLDDTPKELQEEIDSLIGKLADPKVKRTYPITSRLVEIGRPAFPRLLNLFYEIHHSEDPESDLNTTILMRLIVQVIIPMTDCNYGYTPRTATGETPKDAAAKRKDALEKYYGWWGRNSSKAYWKQMEEERNAPVEGF